MKRLAPRLAVSALLTITATAVAAAALAQPPGMVRDIRTVPVNEPPWLTGPHTFVRLGEHLYFPADDGTRGFELWRTDGTTAGTELVADICPGQCAGLPYWMGALAGDQVFFAADDGVHGQELWATDGTPAGTRMVRDIRPEGSSAPTWLTALGDRVAFTALDGAHGRELWISDGTEAGTMMLEDLAPGAEGSDPSALLATQGMLFFNADAPARGREPWASDGTPGAAVPLGDLRPGPEGSISLEQAFPTNPRFAAAVDGLYFFAASVEALAQRQLWVSDGTPGGTLPLTAGHATALSTRVAELTALGSDLYFVYQDAAAGAEIWRSDGTVAGTERVTDVQPGFDDRAPRGLTAVGDRLFFADSTAATGYELWVTDGTGAGTTPVADIAPGPDGSLDWSLVWTGGWPLDAERLLFFADDGMHGAEPWVSDGTATGTFLLRDVAPGAELSHFAIFGPYSPPAAVSGGLAFFAWNPDLGFEPWFTNGTQAGTRLLADLHQQASSLYEPYWFSIADLVALGDRLLFQAVDDEHGLELWTSGGTPGTTRLVKDIETAMADGRPLGSTPFDLVPLEDTLVFQVRLRGPVEDANGQAWRSDGTDAGTFPLVTEGESHGFSKAAGAAFFTNGDGFWTSDGTPAGTRLVAGVDSGGETAAQGGGVLFAGSTDTTGRELYRLDADLDRASLVADLVPGPDSSSPASLTAVGDRLFFVATTPAAGREVWVSDGGGDTHLLADLMPGAEDSIRRFPTPQTHGLAESPPIVGSGGLAFIAAYDGVHGEELWASDGTPEGTRLVADVRPGPVSSGLLWLTDVRGRLYFRANDGSTGAELWSSDGTAAGTRPVADLAPGAASSDPRFLVDVDGVLHFTAWTPSGGAELWRIGDDGVPEPVADLLPGPGSSSPSYLTVAGRRLFFFASDGVNGYEPWSMVLPSRKLHARMSSARTGATVLLHIVLTNPTPVDQPDAAGDELVLPLPGALTPVSVDATGGRAEVVAAGALATGTAAAAAGHTLLWNGPLPAGARETLTVELTLAVGQPNPVALQAELHFDTDADGTNDLSVPSDDPRLPGDTDPTVITAPQVLEVPALGLPGTVLLALLLTVGGLWRLRSG